MSVLAYAVGILLILAALVGLVVLLWYLEQHREPFETEDPNDDWSE